MTEGENSLCRANYLNDLNKQENQVSLTKKKLMSYSCTLLSWPHVLGFFIDVKVFPSYCAAHQCCVSYIHSGWKSDLQLWLRRPVRQSVLAAATSTHIQALFCVSRQVLRLPLWRQRLRRLQGNALGRWSTLLRSFAHLLRGITSFMKLFPQTTPLSEVIVWLASIWWCWLGKRNILTLKVKCRHPYCNIRLVNVTSCIYLYLSLQDYGSQK